MPHIAVDKDTLLAALAKARARLEETIAKVPVETWDQPNTLGDWAAKDVPAHLAHWEALQIGWTAAALRGESPQVPGPGLTFAAADLDVLNRQIFAAHQAQPFAQILAYFRETHLAFIAQLEAMPPELFVQQGWASFTGPKRTLVQYYIHYTFHDGWANKLLHETYVRKPRK